MIIYNTSQLDPALIKSLRVNRDADLEHCISAITEHNRNIIIYGDRGAGKSFLVRLIELELEDNHPNYLPIYLNMVGLFSVREKETELSSVGIYDFPRLILLEMCRTVWVDKLQRDYSELRSELAPKESILKKNITKKIFHLYTLLTAENMSHISKEINSIGFNVAARGEKKEEYNSSWQERALLNFEFFEYVKEFGRDVLNKLGISKILVICDESNHLSLSTQVELLSKYGDLFSNHEIQLIFLSDDPKKMILIIFQVSSLKMHINWKDLKTLNT